VLITLPLGLLALWRLVPEPDAPAAGLSDWRKGLRALKQNKAFGKLILAYVLNAVANGVPASLLLGAIFLIWADILARTLMSPEDMPIGIVTGLIGAPTS